MSFVTYDVLVQALKAANSEILRNSGDIRSVQLEQRQHQVVVNERLDVLYTIIRGFGQQVVLLHEQLAELQHVSDKTTHQAIPINGYSNEAYKPRLSNTDILRVDEACGAVPSAAKENVISPEIQDAADISLADVEIHKQMAVDTQSEGQDRFMSRLFRSMHDSGNPFTEMPHVEDRAVDLYKLYLVVQHRGGYVNVCKGNVWRNIARELSLPPASTSPTSTLEQLRDIYYSSLLPYEHAHRTIIEKRQGSSDDIENVQYDSHAPWKIRSSTPVVANTLMPIPSPSGDTFVNQENSLQEDSSSAMYRDKSQSSTSSSSKRVSFSNPIAKDTNGSTGTRPNGVHSTTPEVQFKSDSHTLQAPPPAANIYADLETLDAPTFELSSQISATHPSHPVAPSSSHHKADSLIDVDILEVQSPTLQPTLPGIKASTSNNAYRSHSQQGVGMICPQCGCALDDVSAKVSAGAESYASFSNIKATMDTIESARDQLNVEREALQTESQRLQRMERRLAEKEKILDAIKATHADHEEELNKRLAILQKREAAMAEQEGIASMRARGRDRNEIEAAQWRREQDCRTQMLELSRRAAALNKAEEAWSAKTGMAYVPQDY